MKEGEWYDSCRKHAFCNFISLLYMNSDCLLVTYVTTLLQLLTVEVISLVLSLVYEMNNQKKKKNRQHYD